MFTCFMSTGTALFSFNASLLGVELMFKGLSTLVMRFELVMH